MRLGVNIGYMGAGYAANGINLACEADRLGFDICWVAEAYGSDAATVIAWIASRTQQIAIASSVFQIPARSPAMTAMTAATLDILSGGRFRLGLGVSGPQVSEGWHGVGFDDPLGRTREYVAIVRRALRREVLTYSGRHWRLPIPNGPGKALTLSIQAVQSELPIYLAAIGPKSLRLTGEIADGWLASFFTPEFAPEPLGQIRAGRSSTAAKDGLEGFDVVSMTPLSVGDDLKVCGDAVRWYAALYLGGMGGRDDNYYNQLASRMGYGREAAEVQNCFLGGDRAGAAAAVPFEFLDATSLLGPVSRIASRMRDFAEAGVRTLAVSPFGGTPGERTAMLGSALEARDCAGLREPAGSVK